MDQASIFKIHNWPAFWTVVCLGTVQVTLTYCSSRLAIETLPVHIAESRRKGYKLTFYTLFVVFVFFTLLLAKLNDTNQHHAEVIDQEDHQKRELLEVQLGQTLSTVLSSQEQLQQLRKAVATHPSGPERASMLNTIDRLQHGLEREANSMQGEQKAIPTGRLSP